jgi:hypothetical protein
MQSPSSTGEYLFFSPIPACPSWHPWNQGSQSLHSSQQLGSPTSRSAEHSLDCALTRSDNNYPNNSYRDKIRFLLFVSWWTFLFTAGYLAFFLINAGSFLVSIASHGAFLAITQVSFVTFVASLLTVPAGSSG